MVGDSTTATIGGKGITLEFLRSRIKLHTTTKLPEYTWHCNRHTFASRLVMKGVDLRTVGELLGHRSFQMTMRYAHLAADRKRSAVARLDKSGGALGLPQAS